MEHEGYHEMMKRGRFDFPIGFYHVEKYHPRFNMPYHWHMEYELIRMLRGGFTISLNEETLHLVPGDIVFIRGWPLLSVSSLKKCNGKIPVMN